jgi:hypothetical protein
VGLGGGEMGGEGVERELGRAKINNQNQKGHMRVVVVEWGQVDRIDGY